jgi:hypothetical protein
MAAPACRHEQADTSGNPRFRRQHRRVDRAIDAVSSPSRDFRSRGRRGGRLTIRADPVSAWAGHERPSGETVRRAEARADR